MTGIVNCRGGHRLSLPDGGKTALLVIDMQRDFIDPQGMCAVLGDDPAFARAIVPRVERLTGWARAQGHAVLHTREGYAPDLSDMHPAKRARRGPVSEGPLGRFLIRGEAGHDFIDRLRPAPGEPVVDKPGFGAFHATDLDTQLRQRGVTHLILCGVTTSCCVHTTLREAVDRGYTCLTVADCCAALELDDHDRALDLIASEGDLFGWVCDLSALTGDAAARESDCTIRAMEARDAESVMAIYAEGIETGHATFQTDPGDWESFSAGKLTAPRLVAQGSDGTVLGFAVLSQVSARPVYRGICEVSVYVADRAKGRGVGHALMATLVSESEAAGIWTLTAGIFPENKASLILHAAHGFRCLGRQRAAAIMPKGPMAGHWRDVLRLERRSDRVR
ncbi:isochorismatase family protein [Pacificispira sp.]|uniref:isochorismatase family protein n=1 Tax=Pacificispira sp. TaxID=2888761 RepID=UPI003B52E65C